MSKKKVAGLLVMLSVLAGVFGYPEISGLLRSCGG